MLGFLHEWFYFLACLGFPELFEFGSLFQYLLGNKTSQVPHGVKKSHRAISSGKHETDMVYRPEGIIRAVNGNQYPVRGHFALHDPHRTYPAVFQKLAGDLAHEKSLQSASATGANKHRISPLAFHPVADVLGNTVRLFSIDCLQSVFVETFLQKEAFGLVEDFFSHTDALVLYSFQLGGGLTLQRTIIGKDWRQTREDILQSYFQVVVFAVHEINVFQGSLSIFRTVHRQNDHLR